MVTGCIGQLGLPKQCSERPAGKIVLGRERVQSVCMLLALGLDDAPPVIIEVLHI